MTLQAIKPKEKKICELKPKDKEYLKAVGGAIKKIINGNWKNAVIMYYDEDGEAMWWHIGEDGEYYRTIGLISDNLIKYSLQEMLSHNEDWKNIRNIDLIIDISINTWYEQNHIIKK